MYSVYKYNNGATAANVLSDVVAILTGTTDVQTLSASCDKANSSILSTIASAGWVVHDAAAASNAQVLKAAVADNPSQFKYLYLSTGSAGFLMIQTYEGWNSTTHAGTNMCANDTTSSFSQRVNFSYASGGILYISASQAHALFHSTSSGSNIGSSSLGAPSGVMEFSRWDPWDTVANGYPSFLSVNSGGFYSGMNPHYAPRSKAPNGADNTGGVCVLYMGSIAAIGSGNSWGNPTNSKVVDAAGNFMVPLLPLFFTGTAASTYNANAHMWRIGGNVTERCNVWIVPVGTGTHLDEMTLGSGQTYVLWTAGGGGSAVVNRIVIPKG